MLAVVTDSSLHNQQSESSIMLLDAIFKVFVKNETLIASSGYNQIILVHQNNCASSVNSGGTAHGFSLAY